MRRAWRIAFAPRAQRQLGKLPERDQTRIVRFLNDRVVAAENPRTLGEALKGELSGLWRYRVGDLRIIVIIQDQHVTVLVVEIGNRPEIYR